QRTVCPAAAPARRGRSARRLSAPKLAKGPPKLPARLARSTIGIRSAISSSPRDARIALDTLQGDTRAALIDRFARAQIFGQDIPHRRALLLVDRCPSRNLVALVRFDRAAIVELELGNTASRRFRRRASVGHAADPDHVTTLLVIGIGVEQI